LVVGRDVRHLDVPGELGSQRDELRPDVADEPRDLGRREVVTQCPEGFEERSVRDPAAVEVQAAANEHASAIAAGSHPELRDEPGLADPCVAADDGHRRLTRLYPAERGIEHVELGRSADDRQA
jgi:hypothetical protein